MALEDQKRAGCSVGAAPGSRRRGAAGLEEAGGVTGLGVAAGPSDPVWAMAALQAEAAESGRAACPQGTERGSCAPGLFAGVPWLSPATDLQSCLEAGPVDTREGSQSSIHEGPPGRICL